MKDYLVFDTESIQEHIINKLNETGEFSDQLFPGSNLSVFIDIFSAMYSCLSYTLNINATESIFTDAQYYESMNRIVKMMGYNPHGFLTSTFLAKIDIDNNIKTNLDQYFPNGIITFPKYTTLSTNETDDNGEIIKYSLVKDFSVFSRGKLKDTVLNETDTIIDSDNRPIFYNGEWIYYSKTFISAGEPFETIVLDGIESSLTPIAYPYIHVYTEDINGDFTLFSPVTNIYNSSNYDKHFEIRLNENKYYELKFGDGINGVRLDKDLKLYIIYLKSNGKKGQITQDFLKNDNSQSLSVNIVGFSEQFLKEKILKTDLHSEYISFGNTLDVDEYGITNLEKIKILNPTASTLVTDLENVESIRKNAPNAMRMGNRVITQQDFKDYVLTNYKNIVLDMQVMNNYEYMAKFFYWLNEYDALDIGIKYFNYKFADSCDFNNIYLWLRSKNEPTDNGNVESNIDSDTLKIIERDLNDKKPLTGEIIFPKVIDKLFTPCLNNNSYDIYNWDLIDPITNAPENMIVIFRDRNTLITKDALIQNVKNIIIDYFAITNTKLGMSVDLINVYNDIMALTGVKSVKTRFWKTEDRINEDKTKQMWYDGLSFACWTPYLIDGKDLQIITGPYKLEDFQFPLLKDIPYFTNHIEVVSDKYSIAELEY